MRRIHPIVFFSTLLAFLAVTSVAAAQSKGDDDDDDGGMTFEPDDVKEPQPEPEPEIDEPQPEPEIEIDEPEPEPEPEPDLDNDLASTGGDAKVVEDTQLGENRVSWKDILVVVRKPFLKVKRAELLPMWGVTMNDNIIRHVQFSAQLNYYLTDVLAVGVEGQFYVKDLREPFDLVALQARRLPTVNKYNFGAALNFHYVPVYGKFAVLDKHIVHWESFFTAGVGFTQSEVLPRDPALQPFKNFLITPNVGASMRFFLTKFLTVNVGIRDYVFVDRFEATDRTEVNGDDAAANADSALINNVVFQAGLSFWFPTSFEYTTFR
jgi:outer membrane beta-barrel protein